MSKHKIKKFISIMLSLAITSTMIPCGAANLVPFNAVKPVVTPSSPLTKTIVEPKNSLNDFSIQSIKSKVSDIFNPQKSKNKLQDTWSGYCGEGGGTNLRWTLDTVSGELTISGTGMMGNYGGGNPEPWNSCTDIIKSLKVENGVNSIGKGAFSGCSALTSVTIPNSVNSIGELAFSSCSSLTSVTIPNSVNSIGYYTFGCCSNLSQ